MSSLRRGGDGDNVGELQAGYVQMQCGRLSACCLYLRDDRIGVAPSENTETGRVGSSDLLYMVW